MPAFAPSSPVPFARPCTPVPPAAARPGPQPSPPRRTRHCVASTTPRAVVATPPPSSSSSTAPPSSLKERSIVTLRGLSDLGSLTLAHELAQRVMVSSSLAGSTVATFFSADAQLLLGSLIGLWTAAAWAARQRRVVASSIADARALPDRWDAAVLYTPTFEDDEIPAAVAWLNALDELDGVAAAELLPLLAKSPRPAARALLANALACFPSRSNTAVATLSLLAADRDARVRAAAADCAAAYAAEGILHLADVAPSTQQRGHVEQQQKQQQQQQQQHHQHQHHPQQEQHEQWHHHQHGMQLAHVNDGDVRACRVVLERVLHNPKPVGFMLPDAIMPGRVQRAAWLADAVDAHVDTLLAAALSQPDLRSLSGCVGADSGQSSGSGKKTGLEQEGVLCATATSANSSERETTVDWFGHKRSKGGAEHGGGVAQKTVDVQARAPTPLFDTLRWSELHGVCALALVPASYELAAMADGSDLPLRFVGLGWLLAVGGMAAYPQSARLWSEFRETMDQEARLGKR